MDMTAGFGDEATWGAPHSANDPRVDDADVGTSLQPLGDAQVNVVFEVSGPQPHHFDILHCEVDGKAVDLNALAGWVVDRWWQAIHAERQADYDAGMRDAAEAEWT